MLWVASIPKDVSVVFHASTNLFHQIIRYGVDKLIGINETLRMALQNYVRLLHKPCNKIAGLNRRRISTRRIVLVGKDRYPVESRVVYLIPHPFLRAFPAYEEYE